jgi:hypothetical protein
MKIKALTKTTAGKTFWLKTKIYFRKLNATWYYKF